MAFTEVRAIDNAQSKVTSPIQARWLVLVAFFMEGGRPLPVGAGNGHSIPQGAVS